MSLSSVQREQYVIGAVLTAPRVLREVQREVMPSDFEDMRHGDLLAGILRMHAEREPIDYLAVSDRLAEWGVRGIGVADLAGWMAAVTTPDTASYHASQIRAASIARGAAKIGAGLQTSSGDVAVDVARAIEDLRKLRESGATADDDIVWLADILAVPEQEDAFDWVIPNVMERGDRLMLSAGEGVGKTTMLRQIALLAAAGLHPFRFGPIDPITVLVVDAENSERQWRRSARALSELAAMNGARDPQKHVAVKNVPVMDITKPNDIGRIHRWIDEARPDLLVLGPLYRLTPGSVNNDDDAAPVLAALESLRERGVAMLIEVHAGHQRDRAGERDLRPRGSSALLGWPEFGMGLRRGKEVGPGGVVRYELVKWRGDRERGRDWPHWFVRGNAYPWEPTVSL